VASYEKVASGIRAYIQIKGAKKSKTFPTKREAKEWVENEEAKLRVTHADKKTNNFTLRQALMKYRDEISIRNTGSHWEQIRINAFLEHPDWLPLDEKINTLTPVDFANFGKERAKTVKPNTILREFGILSAMMEVARKEWQWIKENPVRDVKKPMEPAARERLITRGEIKLLLRGFKYDPQKRRAGSVMESVGVCFLLALRTGMRAGDLVGLNWVHLHPRHVVVEIDKNGRRAGKGREVPLSLKAVRLIRKMKGWEPISIFGLKSQTLDAFFRKIRARQGLSGFTFHDSRHTAATWMAGKYKSNDITAQQAIFDLCKIFGWSDPKRALAYYNPRSADMASRLD
jgi:integrase